jgi:hypothetical protein
MMRVERKAEKEYLIWKRDLKLGMMGEATVVLMED